ncbi:MAG: adventurous gliding motility lipoprotein CglB [Myxococcaceae bacterium]
MHFRFSAIASALALVACQSYDFEPVVPAAISQTAQTTVIEFQGQKPNVMLVVDRSGSMSSIIPCGTGSCPTRLQAVKNAMGVFLPANPTLGRFGLVRYGMGGADECRAPAVGDINVGIPQVDDADTSALTAAATQSNAAIQALNADGSTPTGPTLNMLRDYAALRDPGRENFVLLLTDGLPNCNASNPNTCSNPTACQCTRATCSVAAGTCATGCLDQSGAAAAAAGLRDVGIKTVVVGFGADLNSGTAFNVLNAVAIAGGFGRPCDSDTDCNSGDSCDIAQKQCNTVRFYRAQDADELGLVLAAVSGRLSDPCVFDLQDPPQDPDLLVVRVNGTSIGGSPNTWTLENNNSRIRFHGSFCDTLNAATPANPVQLVIQSVQAL